MKTRAKQAEVLSLSGEKIKVINNCANADFSKDLSALSKDIYIIRYIDKCGNIIGQERIIKN